MHIETFCSLISTSYYKSVEFTLYVYLHWLKYLGNTEVLPCGDRNSRHKIPRYYLGFPRKNIALMIGRPVYTYNVQTYMYIECFRIFIMRVRNLNFTCLLYMTLQLKSKAISMPLHFVFMYCE